jgi:hypothetical protein
MELSAWLGISWNDDMTKPTLAGKPFIAYSDNRIVKHEGVINTKRVNVFKETLGSSEIRFIDYLFTDEMKALKYDIKYGISNRSLALLLAGLIFPLKLELKNWKPYTIIGMLMRRCYMAHRIGRKFIERHKRK